MRYATLLALSLLGANVFSAPVQANPYRWCAVYDGQSSNAENCYFKTLSKCEAVIDAGGGACMANPLFDGRMSSDSRQTHSRGANYLH